MYTNLKRILACVALVLAVWSCHLFAEKHQIRNSLIRFHVVANSDSPADQAVKLKVRDAVLQSIQNDLTAISDISAARAYLTENLPKIQAIVNKTLGENGYPQRSNISLGKEPFDARHYDTFSLPAGVYESLRIILGDGSGENWWCVSFPSLCLPATSEEFRETATGAGFSENTVKTLTGENNYAVRFYILDCLGKVENLLYPG